MSLTGSELKPSTRSMATLIMQNFFKFREYFANIPDARIYRKNQLSLIDTGIPVPNWNAIISNDSQLDGILTNVEEYLSFFKLSCSFWLGPDQESSEPASILKNHGFSPMGKSAAMALELTKIDTLHSPESELKIVPVKSNRELEYYLRILRHSYHLSQYAMDMLYGIFVRQDLKDDSVFYHYIGLLKGKPVGCASLFLAAGAAGIYYVGTLPDYRGRGIGKSMTTHCLKKAQEMNFRFAVLRASELGEPIYRKLGFQEYGHFRNFIRIIHPFINFGWKLRYYSKLVLDKFTGDAIWFS